MNKRLTSTIRATLFLAAVTLISATAHAQSTAYWTNFAGGEWNTAANWNVDLSGFNAPPAEGTNADIGSQGAAVVSYDLPMAATSFGVLSVVQAASTLNVNTNGFNLNPGGATIPLITLGGTLNVNANGNVTATNGGPVVINTGGILNVGGSMLVQPNAGTNPIIINAGGVLNANPGGSLNATGSVTTATGAGLRFLVNGGSVNLNNGGLSFLTGGGGLLSSGSLAVGALRLGGSGTGNTGFMTNSGGTLSAASTAINPNNISSSCLLLINGGVSDLGSVTIFRSSSGSTAFNALGTEGLVVSNGIVRTTSLTVGPPAANSTLTMQVAGGIVTNTGNFIVGQGTAANNRASRFLQTGGFVVSTFSDGVRVAVSNSTQTAYFSVIGGTNVVERILLGDGTNSAIAVVANFTNGANVYVGSGGVVTNNVNTFNVALNNGGLFGAKADWASPLPMLLTSGSFTFNAADLDGTAHNITLSGRLSGGGALIKAGGGTVTLNATNTYTGATTVNNGTLALGPNAAIASTPQISVGKNSVFDVSTVASGFSLVGSQKLSGNGSVTGNLTAPAGTSLQPGGNGVAGTLTFADTLNESGIVNNFDLSDDPTGTIKTNDFIAIAGDLNLTGLNTIQVNALDGSVPAGSVYPVIHYGGNLFGSTANLQVAGTVASPSNNVSTKTIYIVVQAANRAPTNVVWAGNPSANNWDNANASTNWLSGGSLTYFVTGDNVLFDATGAGNPIVNLSGSLNPSNTVVDAAANYVFAGIGTLDGTGGLTKNNTGTLSLLTANNNYPGSTIINGGLLEATNLANGGVASSIGASSSDPTNLVFSGTTLRYVGTANATSDRGATLNGTGGTLEVAGTGTSVTLNGTVTGAGALNKTGPGTLVLGGNNTHAGGTVISNGVLRIGAPANLGTGGLTNYGATFRLATSTSVGNVVDWEGVCTLDLNNNGGNQALDGAWSGSGTVNIINQQNATRVFTMGGNGTGGGNMADFTGTVNIGTNSGTFRFNDGGGDFNRGSSNMVLDLGTGTAIFLNRDRGNFNYLGTLAGGSGTLLTNGTDNTGTTTYVIGGRNTDSTFAGTIGSVSGAPIAIVKTGTGTLTLSGADNYTGATTISNGVLALSGTGTIFRTPNISVVTNTVLDVSGRVDGTLTLNSGQTLQGSGTVRGSVTAGSGAAVTAGDSTFLPDVLTITNALLLQSGSTLNMDLDHYQGLGGLTNDLIQGLASVTYGGTLNLSIYSIETNSVFKLFSAGSYSGSFSSIVPATPGLASKAWDTSFLAVDGTLRITIQRPNFTTIVPSGTDLIISGANGIPGAEYHVLVSTNATLPVPQWTPIATNFFAGTDFQFTLSNAIDPNTPQQFYLLQVIVP